MEILTVGHSNHPWTSFLALLRRGNVTAIADVRSSPYSRRQPQFNREDLQDALRSESIAYVYLGNALGGRPVSSALYQDGVANYEAMARTEKFATGLNRVLEGAVKYKIALMCSEADPLNCHRCLLVGRALVERGVRVAHILGSGQILLHSDIEETLLAGSGKTGDDFFAPRSERLAEAYRLHSRKVAYAESGERGHVNAE